ncbi:hypothetical protein GUJ93_ZPchr0013g37221 [Zizania palustris]|uniref:Uncharacterized protein n=1 Tax=Zizania palustris TaxID=103762 RepID=A0A8J5WTZ1_ZIZPA|nr:hypothetical protein GUJ93_ZPchr0013g37221 [Zizania palustris]KAG8097126.1 hypothetical protein GUJ93_ZPchr0013g37221 [Zizania palustris]
MGDVSLNRPIKAKPAAGGIAQGNRILDMMSSGWTDERHMLYISSMEASFVEQLYNHEQNGNQNDSNGNGFKVLRGGVWEKLKLREPMLARKRGENAACLQAPGSSTSGRVIAVAMHGVMLQRLQWGVGGLQRRKTPDENTEVSDQNFADDEADVDAESSKACKRRKQRSAFTQNHQVVPFEKTFAATEPVGRKDAQDAVYLPLLQTGSSPGCRAPAPAASWIRASGAPPGFAASTLHTCTTVELLALVMDEKAWMRISNTRGPECHHSGTHHGSDRRSGTTARMQCSP